MNIFTAPDLELPAGPLDRVRPFTLPKRVGDDALSCFSASIRSLLIIQVHFYIFFPPLVLGIELRGLVYVSCIPNPFFPRPKTGFCYVAGAGLELTNLLLSSSAS